MPGEFYIEGKKERLTSPKSRTLSAQIQTSVTQVQNNVTTAGDESEG